MPVEICSASPEDYDAVISRIDSWWGGRNMAAMLPRLFFQHFAPWTFVAWHDGVLAGFLAGFRSQTIPEQIYCHFIGVDPSERGSGIGRALYQRLFADALEVGCREVLAVTSPVNRDSIAFHLRLGFEPMAGSKSLGDVRYFPDYDGPGEDRVRLRMNLDARAPERSS